MESATEQLRSSLGRYPPDRYPAQHATAQFHLGTQLLQDGPLSDALEALEAAERLFDQVGMRLEHAKALMAHGAGLRTAGEPGVAAQKFAAAAEIFAALDQPPEVAAARFNLGLVSNENGDVDAAVSSFSAALDGFRDAGQPTWAAAAAREYGTTLLNSGNPPAAIGRLEEAIELAGDRDPAGAGAAANVLGLAQLATDEPAAAVESFRLALGWFPRSIRPAEHAMVKANLALTHEVTGAFARARLHARQALAVDEADAQVRTVAAGVLDRLPPEPGSDLFAVLDEESQDRWETWVRDEVLRWVEAEEATGHAEAARWVHEQAQRGAGGVEYAAALLGVLLELPPEPFERSVAALVAAAAHVDPEVAERFQKSTRSAMARYPMPQWQRMAASFTAAAETAGHHQSWS